MVDVGQGDSIFLRDMKGKTLLIDVGGKPGFASSQTWQRAAETPNAERTLLPYLKSQGIGKIDQLVLTHTEVRVLKLIQYNLNFFEKNRKFILTCEYNRLVR